jgi:hypothetical protein
VLNGRLLNSLCCAIASISEGVWRSERQRHRERERERREKSGMSVMVLLLLLLLLLSSSSLRLYVCSLSSFSPLSIYLPSLFCRLFPRPTSLDSDRFIKSCLKGTKGASRCLRKPPRSRGSSEGRRSGVGGDEEQDSV